MLNGDFELRMANGINCGSLMLNGEFSLVKVNGVMNDKLDRGYGLWEYYNMTSLTGYETTRVVDFGLLYEQHAT